MKKVIAILSIVALASCGGGETKTETVDSTVNKVDTVAAQVDTVAAQVDTAKVVTSDAGSTASPVK